MTHYVVVGAGIVGLATAHRITMDHPDATVTVLEKEHRVGAHQSGHNSGVIHAGVYYQPGSLKARLCRAGARSMMRFCATNGIAVNTCGKLVVATDESELARLHALADRARANELSVTMLDPQQAREHEPRVACAAAFHVASTAIVDFGQVCQRLASLVTSGGGAVRLGSPVYGVRPLPGGRLMVESGDGAIRADYLINCAGLHSDRVARLAGLRAPVKIVPFRGEYYELRPERRDMVRGLIYPVPDPRLPFLGVHLTKMIDGGVHAGPNAVLALAREGYSWGQIRLRDLAETVTYPGLWRLAREHLGTGASEVRRSLSTRRFVASLARLVPALTAADVVRAGAGVRAQAVGVDGRLVDDFLFARAPRQVHVLNAPSPAATSSLEIARHIVAQLDE